jgi:protocatechuate 3,4-dioxygenase beta subunit
MRRSPRTPLPRPGATGPAAFARRELARLGLAAPASLALAAGAAAPSASPALAAPAGGGGAVCVLTPGQTEGPYYFDTRLRRDDITEGLPGLPLRLQLTVLALPNCSPLPGAILDVWHCAADGRYSGYVSTDGAGSAEVRTIYPGWYTGRTPHIHVKVWLGDQALTSQMYLPDGVTNTGRDVATNEADGIFQQTSGRTILSLSPAGSGFTARLVLAVVPGAPNLGLDQTAQPTGPGGPPA